MKTKLALIFAITTLASMAAAHADTYLNCYRARNSAPVISLTLPTDLPATDTPFQEMTNRGPVSCMLTASNNPLIGFCFAEPNCQGAQLSNVVPAEICKSSLHGQSISEPGGVCHNL